MDVAKVAKDYFLSSQSSLLIPNREYGSRKIINIRPAGSAGGGSIGLDTPSAAPSEDGLEAAASRPVSLGTLKGLWVSGTEALVKSGALRLKAVTMRTGNKQWQHPAEALLTGHILYTVKFLGECSVDLPKGTEVVKDAIRKMKFNKHIKRAEGQKPPKVELIISADAVSILDPKTRLILHQYPLHQISYCADDKSDKRMFTFIAKEANGNRHFCYVFDSEKCAEEITLTIGQAFDLAYKRFLENSSTDRDIRKQFVELQKKVQALQYENDILRKRLSEIEKLKDRTDVEEYKRNNKITDLQTVTLNLHESSTDGDNGLRSSSNIRVSNQSTVVGRRLENLILTPDTNHKPSRQTNGTHTAGSPGPTSSAPILSPPPTSSRPNRVNNSRNASTGSNTGSNTPGTPNSNTNPFFGTSPTTNSSSIDPFGMEAFNPSVGSSEQEMIDIQAGFSRGLSFGTDDFNLDDLDPLNQK